MDDTEFDAKMFAAMQGLTSEETEDYLLFCVGHIGGRQTWTPNLMLSAHDAWTGPWVRKIRKAVLTGDAKAAGDLADMFRRQYGKTYKEILETVSKAVPEVEDIKTRWETLIGIP